MSRLDEYAAAVVRRIPDPPRSVSTLTILSHVYRTTEARWIVGLGLGLALPVTIAFGFLAEGDLWAKVVGLGIMVSSDRLFRGRSRNWKSPIGSRTCVWHSGSRRDRGGSLAEPDKGIPTMEAASHGMTIGKRRVYHPAGQFEESFESDSKWANALKPGATIALLGHPTERRVFFDLGPMSD